MLIEPTAAAVDLLATFPEPLTAPSLAAWETLVEPRLPTLDPREAAAMLIAAAEGSAELGAIADAIAKVERAIVELRKVDDVDAIGDAYARIAQWAQQLGRWNDAAAAWKASLDQRNPLSGDEDMTRAARLRAYEAALRQATGNVDVALDVINEAAALEKNARAALSQGGAQELEPTKRDAHATLGLRVPDDEEADKYRIRYVFFASRRELSGTAHPDAFTPNAFTHTRAPEVRYGWCRVTLPLARLVGALPTSLIPELASEEHHIMVQDGCIINAKSFDVTIQERLRRSKQKEILVFVHGFFCSAAAAMARTAQLAEDLDIDGAPVAYLWPSRGSLVRYRADQNEVTGQAINDLADLLLKLRAVGDLDSDNPARIHIIGHSLGCRFIAQALQRLHLLKTAPPTVLDQAIFAAPDLDVVDFIARVGEGSTVANGVTVYGSERDGALMMSKGFNGDLPRAGFALEDLARCGIQTVDASALRGDLLGMGHDKYVSAVDDIRAILWKDLSHAQRAPLFDIREVGAHALYVMRANNDLNWFALSDALSCVRSFGADAVQVLHTALETDGRLTGDVAERARRALILTERLLANQPLFPA